MDCAFKSLGLKPSADYTQEETHNAYIDAVKKAHSDWGGNAITHEQVNQAYECLEKDCRSAFDRCRSSRCSCQEVFDDSKEGHRQAHDRWCTICQAVMPDGGSQGHDQWHRCRISGCNETGIRLPDHLVSKHHFRACDKCAQPQSPDHFWQHNGWWWCYACEGSVEGNLEARIQHLEKHLLCTGAERFTTDLEVLAAYVHAQQYQRCPVCPTKIVAGMIRRHLELRHSFVAVCGAPFRITRWTGMSDQYIQQANAMNVNNSTRKTDSLSTSGKIIAMTCVKFVFWLALLEPWSNI